MMGTMQIMVVGTMGMGDDQGGADGAGDAGASDDRCGGDNLRPMRFQRVPAGALGGR